VQTVLVPTPIGAGPQYHPRPAIHSQCTESPLRAGARVHVELFANRRVVIVPAKVGVGSHCRARLWTIDPTGVVRFERRATLGDLFRVWGRALSRTRLLGFRGAVLAYRNGVAWHGDPRRVPLRDHDELVLEIRGYVPPQRFYRFPRR
jgi:hypothetical protein